MAFAKQDMPISAIVRAKLLDTIFKGFCIEFLHFFDKNTLQVKIFYFFLLKMKVFFNEKGLTQPPDDRRMSAGHVALKAET